MFSQLYDESESYYNDVGLDSYRLALIYHLSLVRDDSVTSISQYIKIDFRQLPSPVPRAHILLLRECSVYHVLCRMVKKDNFYYVRVMFKTAKDTDDWKELSIVYGSMFESFSGVSLNFRVSSGMQLCSMVKSDRHLSLD